MVKVCEKCSAAEKMPLLRRKELPENFDDSVSDDCLLRNTRKEKWFMTD